MRLSILIFATLLAGCGDRSAVPLDALDLDDCPGWSGPVPRTGRDFARASAAELAGRLCSNAKLAAARDVRDSGPR